MVDDKITTLVFFKSDKGKLLQIQCIKIHTTAYNAKNKECDICIKFKSSVRDAKAFMQILL